MANRAGLRKVTKSVKGKKGTVQRSYWVKASSAVKGAAKSAGKFIGKHKGKIAAGAGLALGAAAAYKGAKFVKGYRGMGMSHGDAAKAVFGGLKDRAKGAAERGAHSVVGVGARAHKAASGAAQAISTRVKQAMHRSAASKSEATPSRIDRAKAAVGRAGQHVRSAAAGVKNTFQKYARHSKRGKSKGGAALGSGS